MSNARELALLEKWSTSSPKGARILPPIASPTSPKATKFCCCPNRRRYTLKQPKLTSTLHVRNIFVDNDFNFIDDTTENDDDDDDDEEEQAEEQANDHELLAGEASKQYKRAESWPSARRGAKLTRSTPVQVNAPHRLRRRNEDNVTACKSNAADYDDVVELAGERRSETEEQTPQQQAEIGATEWRHNKSCHSGRSDCLTTSSQPPLPPPQLERKEQDIKERSSNSSSSNTHQRQRQHLQTLQLQQTCGNEAGDPPAATATAAESRNRKHSCENLPPPLALAALDGQQKAKTPASASASATATKTSPLIQRLSELSEFKRKETFSNKQAPNQRTQQQPQQQQHSQSQQQQHCNNCQFCFNQSCRHFSQLQQSLQDDEHSNNIARNNKPSSTTPSSGDKRMMTITTATNVANSFKPTIASGNNSNISNEAAMANGVAAAAGRSGAPGRVVPTTLALASSTAIAATGLRGSVSPTSPTRPPRSNTPSSPLTTTVIKTTMVKRSPANESTTPLTAAAAPTSSAASPSATSASLTLEKSLAFITALPPSSAGNGNRNAIMDASTLATATAPLSVKERIAALVAGNEQQTHKQHDNFINRSSLKNQCNKPMKLTTTATTTSQNNMTSKQQQELPATINGLAGNMCPATAAAAALVSAGHDNDQVDSAVAQDMNDNIQCQSSNAAAAPAAAAGDKLLRSLPHSSLNHSHQHQQHHNPSGLQCGSNAAAAATTMTGHANCAIKTPEDDGHLMLPAAACAATGSDKLAALDNLDLALNLSDMSLAMDDDEDPYFELQEYLERVKHEINEVFELHKARQKLQQQQHHRPSLGHQHSAPCAATQPLESDTNAAAVRMRSQQATSPGLVGTRENQIIDTLKAAVSNDELSRSTESDSGFDSATGGKATCASGGAVPTNGGSNKLPSRAKETSGSSGAARENDNSDRPRVMEISAKNEQQLPPRQPAILANNSKAAKPPKGAVIPRPERSGPTHGRDKTLEDEAKSLPGSMSSTPLPAAEAAVAAASSSTLKRLRKQLQMKPAAEVATDDVNMWANKFLRDLDNLMASDKGAATSSSASGAAAPGETNSACTSPGPTSPMLLSAAATAVIQSRYGKGAHDRYINGQGYEQQGNGHAGIVLRPEKHTTIPLQSFNLDCTRLENAAAAASAAVGTSGTATSGGNGTKSNIAYLRTLSAPTPSPSHAICPAMLHSQGDNTGNAATKHLLGQRQSLACTGALNPTVHDEPMQHPSAGNESGEAISGIGDIKSSVSAAAVRKKQSPMTVLKIEETSASSLAAAKAAATDVEVLHQKRLRQLNMDMDNLRNTSIDQSQQLAALMQQNHYCSGGSNNSSGSSNSSNGHSKHKALMTSPSCGMPKKASTNATASSSSSPPPVLVMTCAAATKPPANSASSAASYLLHGSDATKKGSTSTIWTSEESILRSVGAVDEDNNSTSSSACEEASGVLSSGKSGISLDSSGVENDNNESGIGTATPPKDMSYWKSTTHPNQRHHHHNNPYGQMHQQDNDSLSSLEALRKNKFVKASSVASSDDPDLLEVLSLCDEPQHNAEADDDDDEGEEEEEADLENEQLNKSLKSSNNDEDMDDYDMVDEEDEGHDEFETIPYCDCDCTEDGENSSASAGSSGHARTNGNALNNGTLSDSTNAVVLRRKCAASPIMVPQKCRSHSLDTSSLPNSYHHAQHHQHLHTHAQLARKLQQLRDRHRDRNQLSLALRQEPFQSMLAPTHFHELPSPSSASLHSGHEILDTQELSTKSNSAPLLLKQEKRRDDFANQNVTLRYSRSQSDRYLAEIEAVEACKWLRAAGFPQYAQMYEDHQFPIDLTNVAKDHTNLENDQLQSLYRRLCILNRCANMRIDQSHKAQTPQQKEDSDDENFALSENWTFQRNIRRWSRIGEMGLEIPPAAKLMAAEKTESSSKESSPDRFEDDSYDISGGPLSLTLPGAYNDDVADPATSDAVDVNASPLRRTGSERLKDGAKAILRRVESIKSRRRKRQGIVLSGPQALDLSQLGQRSSMRKPDAVYSTPPSPSAVSPMHSFNKGPLFGNELKVPSQSDNFLSPNRASPKRTPTTPRSMRTSPLHFFTNTMPYLKEGKSDDSSSYYSDSQESSTAVNKMTARKTPSKTRRFLQRTGKVDDIGAHSDSECHQGRKLLIKDANANTTEVKSSKKLSRGGSLNLGRDGKKRDGFRSASFRSRSTTRKEPKTEEPEPIKKTPVVRWHSFQLEERPHMIFRKCFAQKNDPHSNEHGVLFAAMSAGQLQMIRKLALVTLTGYMERYCPTHRSGWNWELPKFIKKIKMPDYKDKRVFGVPLLLILQRSGQTLPVAVRSAFRWLQLNALDQIGLFRKSGVKSRIQKLKELIEFSESSAECMDVFNTQQAYDVADMLKQYFRDLPESLLTTKMSETFAAIFQHLPPEVRLDAVQSAVLLLPDENREILYALLEFLTLVAANSQYNQMNANNLAVCLAPSLFHSSISTGSNSVTASPRRGKGKGSGVPDAKELFEAKASHECLSFMIENYKQIYTAPKEKLGKCKFGYMEESKPLPLEALGEGMQFHSWRGYLYESTSATIKEGREKSRGWISITPLADPCVEIAYKKVGDGHPLRLWRCITEIEGPPKDVLDYIIRQRASWDPNLLQSQTIKKFEDCTEIFQYAIDGQQCTDFCVLRSWRADLPRGACVIVETSIDHNKAKPMFNAVRGVVLASRYLIEPCGSGRSRVMHLARVDVKGKTPEWYNKSYGHISSHYLTRIRLAFKNVTDGPESKV